VSLLYPYALLDASPTLAALSGVAGEPVEILRAGSWIVAAGAIAAAPPSDEIHWRAHDRVVRELAGRADALLPFRFGSAVADLDALVTRLDAREPALRAALALVNLSEQMTLRVFGEPAPEVPPAVADTPAIERPGTRYLEARRRMRDVTGLEPLRTGTAAFVRAERVERQGPPPLLASVYHLVPRAARADYLSAAQGAAARLAPMRLAISGPWPPYAFVPETLA
jgi:hypothetical protein